MKKEDYLSKDLVIKYLSKLIDRVENPEEFKDISESHVPTSQVNYLKDCIKYLIEFPEKFS